MGPWHPSLHCCTGPAPAAAGAPSCKFLQHIMYSAHAGTFVPITLQCSASLTFWGKPHASAILISCVSQPQTALIAALLHPADQSAAACNLVSTADAPSQTSSMLSSKACMHCSQLPQLRALCLTSSSPPLLLTEDLQLRCRPAGWQYSGSQRRRRTI